MITVNQTHNPDLKSWVNSANLDGCDFPIQNLPFAVFRQKDTNEPFRGGVAIGDQIIDLQTLYDTGLFTGKAAQALNKCCQPVLNEFMAMGFEYWSALRHSLSDALTETSEDQKVLQNCLIAMTSVEYDVPARIGDYTDFYTSIHHATTVGKLFRPDNPLLPNYKWVPIGYHGRSSSIGISGQKVHRPLGQTKAPDAEVPTLGPCKRLDYELEVGIYIGSGNESGSSVALDDYQQHVFGLCLFNDWSARDLQAWEYQPLGPFLAKSFASTVSPWIVTMEALAPYQGQWTRPNSDPQPLPYLESSQNRTTGSVDMELEAYIATAKMREENQPYQKLSRSNFKDSYWTVAQMVAHHTINGCNLKPGDFFGSGTQSGPTPEEAGSLLELSNGGKEPITLDNGETRTFLKDGDAILFKGYCQKQGSDIRIGFGEVTGYVVPASS